MLKLSDFDYHLPKERIAQFPAEPRDSARLMVLEGEKISHKKFFQIVEYFEKGDVLVLNDTKVLPAKLVGRKKTGGKVECLVLKIEGSEATCLLKGKIKQGAEISFEDQTCKVISGEKGRYRLKFNADVNDILNRIGKPPLPPYIKENAEIEKYQTVYARKTGSIAAPTAGIHFTRGLLSKIERKGVKIAKITLHIGAGTFSKIRKEDLREHKMESEYFEIDEKNAKLINNAKRLIACGTTSVKTLESAFLKEKIVPTSGWSDLFIYPPYKFKSPIHALITNFHLPKSTLLMLVCAYAGRKRILDAYKEAVKKGYRFYSFGDAMLIIKCSN